jgi:hypothetical protein
VIKERGIRVKTGRLVALAVFPIIFGLASLPVSSSSAFAPSFLDTVSVCPDSTWRADGEVFSIGICISSGLTGIANYSFTVTFDSSVIEIMNAEEGPLPKSFPGDTFFWWYNSGVKSDSIRVTGSIGGTLNGPGEMVTLTFKAKSHGVVNTTDVVMAHSDLRNSSDQAINHETRDGLVTITPIQVVAVCPHSTWKAEGEVFSIGICLSAGLKGVMGYNIAVTFDSSVIEIMNVEEGSLPQSSSDTTFFWWYDTGVKTDSVRVNGAVLGATMDGPGELFTLTFKAKTLGAVSSTDIVIACSELRDNWNEAVEHETRDGVVQIYPATGIEAPLKETGGLVCYPNPFNPATTLVFSPPESPVPGGKTDVSIRVYAADGRLVRNLFSGPVGPEGRRFLWDGKNGGGEQVASGVYFAVAETDGRRLRTKVVLVR